MKNEQISLSYLTVGLAQAQPTDNILGKGYMVLFPGAKSPTFIEKDVFERMSLPLGEDPSKISQPMVDAMVGDLGADRVDECTTLVRSISPSGFTIWETSSCVSKENYDQQIGVDICAKRITDKLWNHLGFVLQWAKDGLIGNIKIIEEDSQSGDSQS